MHHHAAALLNELLPLLADGWRLAPLSVVLQGRVAIGDEIGERLGAAQVVVLIGERPGLTSPDSLGIYLTWAPRRGRTDAERNCISNVRTEGVPYGLAARKLHFLMRESRVRKLSGVMLSTPITSVFLPSTSVRFASRSRKTLRTGMDDDFS